MRSDAVAQTRTRRRRACTAVGIGLLLTLAACGGQGQATPAGSTATPGTPGDGGRPAATSSGASSPAATPPSTPTDCRSRRPVPTRYARVARLPSSLLTHGLALRDAA